MFRYPTLVNLCGLGCMVAGAVTAGVPLVDHAPAATPAVVRVQVVAGPVLVGAPASLRLEVSSNHATAAARWAVSDLVPAGWTYVRGSARLVGSNGSSRDAPPVVATTAKGTLLLWSNVRLPKGASVATVSLTVRPERAAAAPAAGSSWTDRAAVYKEGTDSGTLSLSAITATRPVVDPVATARRSIEVVPVRATETGQVTETLPRSTVEPITEHLVVESARAGRAAGTTVRVYLPGSDRWLGCITTRGCQRPTVAHVRLPVAHAQPDQPLLTDTAPHVAKTPATTKRPAKRAAVTRAAFTVLTWRLGTLRAGTRTTLGYRIDATATTPARTEDLVTATARPVSPAVAPLSNVPALPPQLEPIVAAVQSTAAAPNRDAVEATTVQTWPVAAPSRQRDRAATNAARRTGAVARTNTPTAAPSTTTTTVATSTRDPFNPPGATGSTTTTTGVTTTGVTTTGATTTTTTTTKKGGATPKGKKPGGSLATTGANIEGTVELGLALGGGGALLLLAGRRRRHPPGETAGPTEGDG
jgi:hypothetical protein